MDWRSKPRPPRGTSPLAPLLQALGVTRAEAAARLGMSRTMLQDRLAGRCPWSADELDTLTYLTGAQAEDVAALAGACSLVYRAGQRARQPADLSTAT